MGGPNGSNYYFPNIFYLTVIFQYLKFSFQISLLFVSETWVFLRRGVVSTSPNPQPGGPGHPF